jgi:hypothetical protein
VAYSNDTGLPSVTNILKPWIDTRWFTEESCIRGDYAHDCVSSYLTGQMMFTSRPEYDVYFKSFKKFEPRIKKVLLVEKRLADYDLGFCGQMDLVFVDEDEVVTLCDWKTSKAVMKYYQLQLGGYSILLKSQTKFVPKKLMIVRLRDEEVKKPLISVYSVEESERLFLNQLELFNLLWGNQWKNKLS